ncbi:hypothetical protein ACFOE0_17890 [Shewanella submarina]|uniref:Uncharacterized protein n=1 Tax=Shewanella submarina TaxID=2016376 RepID=A0ABV7GI96_9GAMM|nr:hypothetical protein [Shewanella submarina]
MKNLMVSVKNAIGMRASASDGVSSWGCGGRGDIMWRWYLYHSM